jgi:hypothetical protein
MMFLPESMVTRVHPLSPRETELAVHNLILSGLFRDSNLYVGKYNHLHMLSQGNWHALLQATLQNMVVF